MKMKLLGALSFAMFFLSAVAQPVQPTREPSQLAAAHVKSLKVETFNTERITLSVNLELTLSRQIVLNNLRLSSVKLNGMPVYVDPLDGPITFKKGNQTPLTLSVSILFRDITSTDPLRAMLEKQNVHISGELQSGAQAGLVEKLALATLHPVVQARLEQDVPVEVGGGELARSLALSVLSMGDLALKTAKNLSAGAPSLTPEWARTLEDQVKPSLMVVCAAYSVERLDKEYPISDCFLGFRVGSDSGITTAEALGPWKYDLELQGAIHNKDARLGKSPAVVSITSLDEKEVGPPVQQRDLDSLVLGAPDKVVGVEGGASHAHYKMPSRNSPDTMARLHLVSVPAPAGLTAAAATTIAEDSWDQVLIFRLRPGSSESPYEVEALRVTAKRDGKSIQFSPPVDSSAFGSPIVSPEGVIGVVQDERSGAFLPASLGGSQ